MPLDVYDATITVLRRAVGRGRLDEADRLAAIRRLDEQSRQLEESARGPDLSSFVAEERRRAPERGGRTVFDDAKPTRAAKPARSKPAVRNRGQLLLPGMDS